MSVSFSSLKIRVETEMREFGVNLPEVYYIDAINDAIRDSWPEFYAKAQYTSIATETAALVYSLPSACVRVFKVELQPSDSSNPSDVLRRWDVDLRDSGNRIRFLEPYDSGRYFRIWAAEKYTELTNDSDTTTLDAQYIIAYARARLHEIRSASGNGEWDQGAELAQAQYWWGRVKDLKRRAPKPSPTMTPLKGAWR